MSSGRFTSLNPTTEHSDFDRQLGVVSSCIQNWDILGIFFTYYELIRTEEWVIVYSMVVVMEKQHCSAVADEFLLVLAHSCLCIAVYLKWLILWMSLSLTCKYTFGCISDDISCQVWLNSIVLVQCKQCWKKEENSPWKYLIFSYKTATFFFLWE